MSTSPGLQSDNAPQLVPVEPNHEQRWAAKTSGQQQAFAWALAVLSGCGAISAAPRDTIIRLLLPVVIMFLYVWITYPRDSGIEAGIRSARIAQLADSSYFLGFLWTLWALIDSFVLKRTTAAETAFRVFGYALVTTAAGMATRLYLLQFKYGAEDQAAEAEFTVERSLQIFSTAMQEASRSIQSFHTDVAALDRDVTELSGTLENLDQRFNDTHQETSKAIKDNINAVVEDIRNAMKSPVQEYGRAIRAFTADVDHQSQFFTETLQASSADVGRAVKDATEKTHKLIQETGERIASDHTELAARLQTQGGQVVEELRELTARIAALDLPPEGLGRFTNSFTELERSLVTLAQILGSEGDLRINVSCFAREIQNQTEDAGKALAGVAGRLNAIKVPPEIIVDVSDLTRSIEHLQKAADGLLQRAADNRWEKAPQTASDALLKLSTSVNALRQALNSAEASLQNVLAKDRTLKWNFWRRS